jgi:hypothetical protein
LPLFERIDIYLAVSPPRLLPLTILVHSFLIAKEGSADDTYFFVERKMAPHRLPAITTSSMASEVPPPDFWSRPIANFQVWWTSEKRRPIAIVMSQVLKSIQCAGACFCVWVFFIYFSSFFFMGGGS